MIYRRRRYYRAAADESAQLHGEPATACAPATVGPLAGLFEQRREAAAPEVPMPLDFVHRARLVAAGYSAIDELEPATERELMSKGFTRAEARAIRAAVAALTA
jgi:hypothetical protein